MNNKKEIPKQLQEPEFRFVLLGFGDKGKIPFEKEWQTKNNYSFDNPKLLNHKGNFGVIGGYGKLRILDIDDKKLSEELEKKVNTYTVKTGSGGRHFYFISDYESNHVLIDELGELRANNYQVVSAPCIHPNGNRYEIINDVPISKISKEELYELIKPYLREENSPAASQDPEQKGDTSRSGLEFRKVLALLRQGKTREEIYKAMNAYSKWSNSPEQYRSSTFEKAENIYLQDKNNKLTKDDLKMFTRRGQIEMFWKEQPFYYDKSKIFWLWDKENYKWILSDEVDFCNLIYNKLQIETINSKVKAELVEGFKQVGRMNKPKEIKKSWVQFKDKIYDVKTGECFNASPEYFVTNPIPWKVGDSEETPTIDKYFDDWIKGQDRSWKETLYQIIAYNICLDKFMQRIIALVGGGSNGKGTFIKLNYKFLGPENCVASEIKDLSENHFEPAVLFRKLLCVMGEVSSDDLKNTNQLKKLGGEDKISFQFKGKTPFTDDNTATCICLTNSMPITPDKTQGFYRKWLIVDFLNQFKVIDKNLIEAIPDWEFENLAKKSLRILKELYDKPHFSNEGDFDERAKRYEERSNPVIKFVETKCKEEAGEFTTLREFTNYCNNYLKYNNQRVLTSKQIGKLLRDEGFIVGNRKLEDDISAVVILNLKIKEKL